MGRMLSVLCGLAVILAPLFTPVEAMAQPDSSFQPRVAAVVARDLGLGTDLAHGLDLRLLAPGLSLSHDVGLRVADVRSGGKPNLWLLRMECATRSQCIPFEVALRATGVGTVETPTPPKEGGMGHASQIVPPAVKPGQKVTLAEEVSGMHLSAPGICLETGSPGQRIRVRNLASGRVVQARVSNFGKLMVEP